MRVSLANKPLGMLVESPVHWGCLNNSVHKVLALQLWRPEFNPPNPHKRPVLRHALVIPELERGSPASLPGHLGKFQANERPCLKQGGWRSGGWHLRCPLDSMWTCVCFQYCDETLASSTLRLLAQAAQYSRPCWRRGGWASPKIVSKGELPTLLTCLEAAWAREWCSHSSHPAHQHLRQVKGLALRSQLLSKNKSYHGWLFFFFCFFTLTIDTHTQLAISPFKRCFDLILFADSADYINVFTLA